MGDVVNNQWSGEKKSSDKATPQSGKQVLSFDPHFDSGAIERAGDAVK